MAINTVLPEDAVAFLTEVAVVVNGKYKPTRHTAASRECAVCPAA